MFISKAKTREAFRDEIAEHFKKESQYAENRRQAFVLRHKQGDRRITLKQIHMEAVQKAHYVHLAEWIQGIQFED